MAFSTTNEMFTNLFMNPAPDLGLVDEFLSEVLKYLESRSGIDEADAMAEWIRADRGVDGFNCRCDMVDPMADQLIDNGVPFVVVDEPKGNMGFLIRSMDRERVLELRDLALKQRAHFCRVVDRKSLEHAVLMDGNRDKGILYLGDLSAEEAQILEEICDEFMDGDLVAIDEMNDGTFRFGFYARKAMRRKKKQEVPLEVLIALMMMRTKGFRGQQNLARARKTIEYREAIAKVFRSPGQGKDTYIVGKKNNYIRVGADGFAYGVPSMEHGELILEELYSVPLTVPDFEAQLVSYLARIEDKTFTNDVREVMRHFSGDPGSRLNFPVPRDDVLIGQFEKQLLLTANDIIRAKIENDPEERENSSWMTKFINYMNQLSEVLDTVRIMREDPESEVEIPDGYQKEDIERMVELCKAYGLGLNQYKTVIAEIGERKALYEDQVRPQLVETLEQLHKKSEKEHDERDSSRDHSRRGASPRRE